MAGKYDVDFGGAESNPAASAGQRQVARAGQGVQSGNPAYSTSFTGQVAAEQGYMKSPLSWYTGANLDGTNSGWNTDFTNTWREREDAAYKSGKDAIDYFKGDDATGVVTWGDRTKDDDDGFRLGDVYEDGRKVANIYADFDRNTANLMMGHLVLGKDMGSKVFSNSEYQRSVQNLTGPDDVIKVLDDEVFRAAAENSKQMVEGHRAYELQKETEGQDWAFGAGSDAAVTAAGAGGGAAVAAGAAALFGGPVGWAVAGGIAVGGAGAWFNRDEIQTQIARSKVVTDRGFDEDVVTGTGELLKSAGGVMATFASPTTNLYHGLYDEVQGESGDKVSEFQVDSANGDLSTWMLTAGNVGTMLLDSAGLFGTRAGMRFYTAQMGTQVGGGVLQATPGAESFDYNSAQYDSIYTDEEGNFSASNAAFGLANVGIDAVQMALPTALTRSLAPEAKALSGSQAKGVNRFLPSRFRAEEGDMVLRAGGVQAVKAADGTVKSVRPTLSMLAPSEHFMAATAWGAAKRKARASNMGTVTADDFFREVANRTAATRPRDIILATGVAEGYEEAVQAVVEPLSHDQEINGVEVAKNFAAGLGAGAGMAMPIVKNARKVDATAMTRANLLRQDRGEQLLSTDQWQKMTDDEKQIAAEGSSIDERLMSAGVQTFMDAAGRQVVATVPDVQRVVDAVNKDRDAAARNNAVLTDGATKMGQLWTSGLTDENGLTLPDQGGDEVALMSLNDLVGEFRDQQEGLAAQAGELERVLQPLLVEGLEVERAVDVQRLQRAQQVNARAQELIGEFLGVLEDSRNGIYVPQRGADGSIVGYTDQVLGTATVQRVASQVNQALREMYYRTGAQWSNADEITRDAAAVVATLIKGRDPIDADNLYAFLPQVDVRLTELGYDRAKYVSPAILKAMNGDWDGDGARAWRRMAFTWEQFASIRSGSNLIGQTEAEQVETGKQNPDGTPVLRKAYRAVMIDNHFQEDILVESLSHGLSASATERERNASSAALANIKTRIRNMLRDPEAFDQVELETVLDRFEDRLRANSDEARGLLLDELWESFGPQLEDMARTELFDIWRRLNQVVQSEYRRMQIALSTHDSMEDAEAVAGVDPNFSDPVDNTQTTRRLDRRVQTAPTPLTTLFNLFDAQTVFRIFTSNQYGSHRSTSLQASQVETGQRGELAQHYALLSSKEVLTATEKIAAKDSVTKMVKLWIHELSRGLEQMGYELPGGTLSEAVVANMSVQAATQDEAGQYTYTGEQTTLVQQLLQMALNIEKNANRDVWDVDTAMQARHARLGSWARVGKGNAGRAFMEIYGNQPISTLTGPDGTGNLPGHLTLEQYMRRLTTLNSSERRKALYSLRDSWQYFGRESGRDLPFSLDEVVPGAETANAVTPYYSVVESLAEATNMLDSEHKASSDRVMKAFVEGRASVRQLMGGFMEQAGLRKQAGETDVQFHARVIQEMFEQRRDLANRFLAQIPHSVTRLLYEYKDGVHYINPMIYMAYAQPTPERSAAFFLSNVHVLSWMARGAQTGKTEPFSAREYNSLEYRIHQVFYRLEKMGGEHLERFVLEYLAANDLSTFYTQLNENKQLMGDEAPIQPFSQDTADFALDRQNGGWGGVQEGADLAAAVRDFATAVGRASNELGGDAELLDRKADVEAEAALRRAYAEYDGKDLNSVSNETDRRALRGWINAFQAAQRRGTMIGPQALLQTIIGSLPGVDANSAVKGQVQPHLKLFGSWVASSTNFGLSSPMGHVLSALTRTDEAKIRSNMAQLVGRDVRITLADGRVLDMKDLDDRKLFELYANDRTRDLATAMIFPGVMDSSNPDFPLQHQPLLGKSLHGLTSGRYETEMFTIGADGRLTIPAAQRLLSAHISETVGKGGDPYEVVSDVIALGKQRLANTKTKRPDYENIGLLAVRDYMEGLMMRASTLMEDARTPAAMVTDPDTGTERPAFDVAVDRIQKHLWDNTAARFFGFQPQTGLSIKDYLDKVIKPFIQGETVEAVNTGLAALNKKVLTNEVAEEILAFIETHQDRQELANKLERLMQGDDLSRTLEQYALADVQDAAQVRLRKVNLVRYAKSTLGFLDTSVELLRNASLPNKLMRLATDGSNIDDVDLSTAEWEALSAAVINHHISNSLVLGAPRTTGGFYKASPDDSTMRYADPTFARWQESTYQQSSAQVQAMLELYRRTHTTGNRATVDEIVQFYKSHVYHPDEMGLWDPALAMEMIEAHERLLSSSSWMEIPANGNTPKEHITQMASSRRQLDVPPEELLSEVSFSADTLANALDDLETTTAFTFARPDGTKVNGANLSMAVLHGAAVRRVRIRYVDGSGTRLDAKVLDADDPTKIRPGMEATIPWVKYPEVRDSGYEFLSLERLSDAVEMIQTLPSGASRVMVDVEFFHPQSQPANTENFGNSSGTWYHNVFFGGVSGRGTGDDFDSELGYLWMSKNGLNQTGQGDPLAAAKKGRAASKMLRLMDLAHVERLEDRFDSDLAGVLHAKTQEVMAADLRVVAKAGEGQLPLDSYRQVYNQLKRFHWVYFVDPETNQLEVLDAEQVIARQAMGEALPADAKLFIPSIAQLRTMLGEVGTLGTKTEDLTKMLEISTRSIPQYRGVTALVTSTIEKAVADTTPVERSTLVSQTIQRAQVARPFEATRALDLLSSKIQAQQVRADETLDARLGAQDFDTSALTTNNMNKVLQLLQRSNIRADLTTQGVPVNTKEDAATLDKNALDSLGEYFKARPLQMLWLHEDTQDAGGWTRGIRTRLESKSKVSNAVRGDVVAINLDTIFTERTTPAQALDRARELVQEYADAGAGIAFIGERPHNQTVVELQPLLQSLDMYPSGGSVHVYLPNERARGLNLYADSRRSTLDSVEEITSVGRKLFFVGLNSFSMEGGAWINSRSKHLADGLQTTRVVNLLALGDFNEPVSNGNGRFDFDAIKGRIRALRDNAEDLEALVKQAGTTLESEYPLSRSLDRLIASWDAGNSGLSMRAKGLELQTGDIEAVLLSSDGKQIILQRNGFGDVPPVRQWPAGQEFMVSKSEVNPDHEPKEGVIDRIESDGRFGARLHLTTQAKLGLAKLTVDASGKKNMLGLLPEDAVILPKQSFSKGGRELDVVTDLSSDVPKDVRRDMVVNARTAIGVFGLDTQELLSQVFAPNATSPEAAIEETRMVLRSIREELGGTLSLEQAQKMINPEIVSNAVLSRLNGVAALGGLGLNWDQAFGSQATAAQRLAYATVVYLMTPSATVDEVTQTAGLLNSTSPSEVQRSRYVGQLWAQVFDDIRTAAEGYAGSEQLRDWFFDQLNAKINNHPGSQETYTLHKDWTLTTSARTEGGEIFTMQGYLAMPIATLSQENPATAVQVPNVYRKQDDSYHNSAMARAATGGLMSIDETKLEKVRARWDVPITQMDTVEAGYELISRLTRGLPKIDRSFNFVYGGNPASNRYSVEAEADFAQTRQALSHVDWTPRDIEAWEGEKGRGGLRRKIAKVYGLDPEFDYIVDYWVRATAGAPVGEGDFGSHPRGWLSPADVLEFGKDVLSLGENGYLPTVGGEIPLTVLQDLQLIYRSNRNRTGTRFQLRNIVSDEVVKKDGRWKVRARKDRDTTGRPTLQLRVRKDNTFLDSVDETWDQWVQVALGSVVLDDVQIFDPMFLTALDGAFQSYRAPGAGLGGLAVSMDTMRMLDLQDEQTNRIAVSIVAPRSELYRETNSLEPGRSLISDVLDGRRFGYAYRGQLPPASRIAKRRARARAWRMEDGSDIPVPLKQGIRTLRKRGIDIAQSGATEQEWVAALHNMVLGNSMVNPGLWVGSAIEKAVRGGVETATDAVLGTKKALVREIGAQEWESTVSSLAENPVFRGMVMGSSYYLRPEKGHSKFTQLTAKYASLGTRMQDFTRGRKVKRDAKAYLLAVSRWMETNPYESAVGMESLMGALRRDPEVLEEIGHPAAAAGRQAVATLRGTQASLLGKAIDGFINPLQHSSNGINGFIGNVLLQVPFMFRGFFINTATLLTGTQVVQPLLANMLEGTDSRFFAGMQARMRGDSRDFDPENSYFDLSEITEGADLMRLYVQGAVTHTQLFSLGMLLGGLNLSGESDEERRRRKLSKMRAVPMWYAPDELQNDFRNEKGIFVDDIPILSSMFTDPDDPDAKKVVNLPWMVNVFAAPMVGMSKFFQSGELDDLNQGFLDGIGSLPYTGELSVQDAIITAATLGAAMQEYESIDDSHEAKLEANSKVTSLATNMVSYWERKLFENNWLSSAYVWWDTWDRDPYKEVERDADKNLQGDAYGNTLSSQALSAYRTEETDPVTGETREVVKEGYLKRREEKLQLYVWAEKRPVLAAGLALFTGNKDAWRYNMPVKVREVELDPVAEEEQKALILGALQTVGMPLGVNEDEAIKIARNTIAAETGKWLSASQIPEELVMSIINENGREVLTKEGAWAVVDGLYGGTVKLGDPSLAGVYITRETRDEIFNEWNEDLIAEGMSLGLDEQQAKSRANRLWWGDTGANNGLRSLLYSDQIPYEDTLQYNQLNTTYVMGPNGYPMATGFTRSKFNATTGGVGFESQINTSTLGNTKDSQGNVQDATAMINTGLRGIVRVPNNQPITDREFADMLEEAMQKSPSTYTPYSQSSTGTGGYGYGGYRRRGGYSRGGGGGYSSSGYASFVRMNNLPESRAPYGNSIPNINTSNPIIRRADVRRERVWSERGRLKQWQ